VSDYETAQRRRNIIVGLFVILGLCALTWLIFKFEDLPTIASRVNAFEVYVQFPTAPGVEKDTPVRFCGYQIGRVTSVLPPEVRRDLITGREYHQTVAVLNIDKRYRNIPSNVEIKLMTRGLGSSYIELKVDPEKIPAKPLDPNRPETSFLQDKMLVQGSTGMTSEFFPEESQKKLVDLVDGIGLFIKNANDIIGDPGNKQNVKATLANLTQASQQITQTAKQAGEIIDDARKALDEYRKLAAAGQSTLNSIDAKAERLVGSLVSTTEELGKASSQLRQAMEKVNAGQGTAGKLVNDARLYESLLESMDQLQVLLKDIKSLIDKVNEKGLRSIY
jgi:phospholipid/cholesterol/gamma-HCH transport system substrate-binding protein